MMHPVPPDELRAVNFPHVGFDGMETNGMLIVHRIIEPALTDILDFAYRIGFPIHKAVPIDDPRYNGDDELSMADNNSSCFNDRTIAGTDRISMHALGLAVDINPALNPYLSSEGIWYPDESHIDRSELAPGMFSVDHPVVQAFIAGGFEWGGTWERPDYHHFEWIL